MWQFEQVVLEFKNWFFFALSGKFQIIRIPFHFIKKSVSFITNTALLSGVHPMRQMDSCTNSGLKSLLKEADINARFSSRIPFFKGLKTNAQTPEYFKKFFIFLVKTLKSKANSNYCDVRTIILWFKLFLSTAETKAWQVTCAVQMLLVALSLLICCSRVCKASRYTSFPFASLSHKWKCCFCYFKITVI